MQERVAKRLLDAYEFCSEIEHLFGKVTLDNFLGSRPHQLAAERLVEITGEALHGAEVEAREAGFDLEIANIRQIVGMRNVLAHAYEHVLPEAVWRTMK